MKFFLSIFLIQCILALIYCDRESFSLSDTSDLLNDVENDRDPLISLDQNAYGDMLFSSKPSSLKSKTVNYKGYSMDMSVDTFKSLVSDKLKIFLLEFVAFLIYFNFFSSVFVI